MICAFEFTYIDEEQPFEILCWMVNEILPIRSIDPAVTIIDLWILELFSGRSVELDTGCGYGLEWS
jgi:hypothetical protein